MEQKELSKKITLGTILLAPFLPWIVMIAVGLILNPKELPPTFTMFFSNLVGVVFISLFSIIPFAALANLTKEYFDKTTKQISGVIGAWVGVLGLSLFFCLGTWVDYFLSGYVKSVGMGFSFIAGPILALILMPIFYGLGLIIGKLIATIKSYKRK